MNAWKVPYVRFDLICTGPVNICSDGMVTNNQLVDIIMAIAGDKMIKKFIKSPIEVRGISSDNHLIEEKLGWRPNRVLLERLAKTCIQIKVKAENSRVGKKYELPV